MTDYIDRQAAIDALEREKTYSTAYKDGYAQTDYFKQYNMGLADGIKALNKLPTAEVGPVKHGRWTPVTNGRGGFECSICHSYAPSYQDGVEWLSPYCPNCGARMTERSEEC